MEDIVYIHYASCNANVAVKIETELKYICSNLIIEHVLENDSFRYCNNIVVVYNDHGFILNLVHVLRVSSEASDNNNIISSYKQSNEQYTKILLNGRDVEKLLRFVSREQQKKIHLTYDIKLRGLEVYDDEPRAGGTIEDFFNTKSPSQIIESRRHSILTRMFSPIVDKIKKIRGYIFTNSAHEYTNKNKVCKGFMFYLNSEEIASFNNLNLNKEDKSDYAYVSAYAPSKIKRNSYLMVQVFIHTLDDAEEIKQIAKEGNINSERKGYNPLNIKLNDGDKLNIELNIYGKNLLLHRNKDMIWKGDFIHCGFGYLLPSDLDVNSLFCETIISINGAPIGGLEFLVNISISSEWEYIEPCNINTIRYKRTFISYAHEDEQMARSIAIVYKVQGIEYFFDRDYLGPGDEFNEEILQYIDSSNLFVLFWSKNAAKSSYIAKEKARALSHAHPQVSRKEATIKICPISIEPKAELPVDMKDIYNFVTI